MDQDLAAEEARQFREAILAIGEQANDQAAAIRAIAENRNRNGNHLQIHQKSYKGIDDDIIAREFFTQLVTSFNLTRGAVRPEPVRNDEGDIQNQPALTEYDENFSTHMSRYLEPPASRWFNSLNQDIRNDINALRISFLASFEDQGEAIQAEISMKSIIRDTKESIAVYTVRILHLATIAFPGEVNENIRNHVSRKAFLDGLRPHDPLQKNIYKFAAVPLRDANGNELLLPTLAEIRTEAIREDQAITICEQSIAQSEDTVNETYSDVSNIVEEISDQISSKLNLHPSRSRQTSKGNWNPRTSNPSQNSRTNQRDKHVSYGHDTTQQFSPSAPSNSNDGNRNYNSPRNFDRSPSVNRGRSLSQNSNASQNSLRSNNSNYSQHSDNNRFTSRTGVNDMYNQSRPYSQNYNPNIQRNNYRNNYRQNTMRSTYPDRNNYQNRNQNFYQNQQPFGYTHQNGYRGRTYNPNHFNSGQRNYGQGRNFTYSNRSTNNRPAQNVYHGNYGNNFQNRQPYVNSIEEMPMNNTYGKNQQFPNSNNRMATPTGPGIMKNTRQNGDNQVFNPTCNEVEMMQDQANTHMVANRNGRNNKKNIRMTWMDNHQSRPTSNHNA